MILKFKTFNHKIVQLYLIKVLWPLVDYLNITCKLPVNKPLQSKSFIIKKSPHVNSKSAEEFKLTIYSLSISLPTVSNLISDLRKFRIYILFNLKTGFTLQILKKF